MKSSYIIPSKYLVHIELPNKQIPLSFNKEYCELLYVGFEKNLFDIIDYARRVKLSDILSRNSLDDLLEIIKPNISNCTIYIEVDIILGKKQSDLFFIKRGLQAYNILSKAYLEDQFIFLVEKSCLNYMTELISELSLQVAS